MMMSIPLQQKEDRKKKNSFDSLDCAACMWNSGDGKYGKCKIEQEQELKSQHERSYNVYFQLLYAENDIYLFGLLHENMCILNDDINI